MTESSVPWFTLRWEYVGSGIATFADPPGELRGSVAATLSENGEEDVVMEVAQVQPSDSPRRSLLEFLMGTRHTKGGVTRISFDSRRNPCTGLTVTTPLGTYRTKGRPHYSVSAKLDAQAGKVTFHVGTSEFETSEERQPYYWVLPLTNFISDFLEQSDDALKAHPLRLYRPTSLPDASSAEAISLAERGASFDDRLITFTFMGDRAFIERIAEYRDREVRLTEGGERSLVTAIMVGRVGNRPCAAESLGSWFPFHLLAFLSMATGTQVGAPLVEFRDERGELVRRLHRTIGPFGYGRGHAAIREGIHYGIGPLLSAASRLSVTENGGLIVGVQSLVKGGLFSLMTEDRFDHLCRSLDGLCEFYDVKTIDVVSILGARRADIQSILKEANSEVAAFAKAALAAGDEAAAALLGTIANSLSGAGTPQLGFGRATLRLLERFALPDGAILARHYTANPRADKRDWPALLSYYRGTTMHRNYFDIRGGADLNDVAVVMFHLQDVLTRIILKAVGYDGTYQPTVVKDLADMYPDWVTDATSAKELGYV